MFIFTLWYFQSASSKVLLNQQSFLFTWQSFLKFFMTMLNKLFLQCDVCKVGLKVKSCYCLLKHRSFVTYSGHKAKFYHNIFKGLKLMKIFGVFLYFVRSSFNNPSNQYLRHLDLVKKHLCPTWVNPQQSQPLQFLISTQKKIIYFQITVKLGLLVNKHIVSVFPVPNPFILHNPSCL